MSKMSERILGLIKKNKISYGELSKRTGFSKSTLYRYAVGEVDSIPITRIEILAQALNTTTSYIMGWDDFTPPKNKQSNGVKIPVLSKVISGVLIDSVENIIDYEEISEQMARNGEYFALKVKGISMEPKFSEGDVVIVKKQEYVDNGDIAVVLINGYDTTIKRIIKSTDGINLIPLNPTCNITTYSNKDIEQLPVKIIGKVIELRAKF